MDVDPLEYVDEKNEEQISNDAAALKAKSRLNTLVAITVALLATFMPVCKIKDDNIVQAMQQAQADKIDNYAWYQARNIREEVANGVVVQMNYSAASCGVSKALAPFRCWRIIIRQRSECSLSQQAAGN